MRDMSGIVSLCALAPNCCINVSKLHLRGMGSKQLQHVGRSRSEVLSLPAAIQDKTGHLKEFKTIE